MKKLTRALTLLLAVVMVFALAACGGSGTPTNTQAPSGNNDQPTTNPGTDKENSQNVTIPEGALTGSGKHGGTGYVQDSIQKDVVRVAATDVPSNVSPWTGSTSARHQTMYSVYQPLFEFDKTTGNRVLVLAETIEQTDELTYRVKLREGIVDSDGKSVTADDAVYSVKTCAELGNVSGMKYIEDVQKVDDLTLDITMNTKADYQFNSSVSMIFIVSQESYEASSDGMNTLAVGTGPYKMAGFESGSSLTLVKVDNYWGAPLNDRDANDAWYYFAQNVDKIEYTKISEASQASIALETGNVDVAYQMTSKEADRMKENKDFNVWSTVDTKSFNLFFNCGELSPMSNQLLRQAVCYAVDADGARKANGGYGVLSTTFGAAVFADCNPDWANEDYYNYNPEKAKELIAESGFDTNTTIRLMVASNSKECLTIAQVVQGYLMAVGLKAQIDEYDGASFATYRYDETMYDIRIQDSSFSCLADIWTQFLSAGKKDKSYAQMKDEHLEELLAALGTKEGRSTENVDAAHEYIKEQAYVYGLYCRQQFDTTTADILEFVYMPKLFPMPGAFCYSK